MAHVPNSGIHRLVISAFTAEKITERPFLGWGFGTSRAIPGGNAVLTVRDVLGQGDKAMPPEIAGMNFLPLHPHNYALQWTLELGVVGLVLGLWVVTAAVRRMAVLLPIPSAGGAVLAQVGVWWGVSALSYGAWQGWWLGAVALVCAITAALIREEEATR
ncbi:MAG: hypothetical protein A2516_05745 [Alphaproteobacteria bacterium RIFOXYD12_FULL_60_8]|nr:MAG: hypothetical protein A2516_05745 [Alphaproteobacteria bacterium RIFOXYD12_FULL_60_8]